MLQDESRKDNELLRFDTSVTMSFILIVVYDHFN
jgi:hypothetical protein